MKAALACFAVVIGTTGCFSAAKKHTPALVKAPAQSEARIAMFRVGTGSGARPHYDIVTANADGSGLQVVIGSSRGDIRPALFGRASWSPDGRKLAFATDVNFARGNGPLYVVDADGSNVRRLPGTAPAFEPTWSPDGKTIVFARRGKGLTPFVTASLWSIGVDGRNLHRLLDEVRGRLDVPDSWSPDGTQLAFTRAVFKPFAQNGQDVSDYAIYVMRSDGSGLRKLADRGSEPAWSPDGRQIAYSSDRDRNGELSYGDTVNYANELYVMNSNGSGSKRLTSTKDLNEGSPSWSPDGSRIAFQRGKVIGNAEGTIVMVVNADGTCPKQIAADPHLDTWYATPTWRPGTVLRGGGALRCKA